MADLMIDIEALGNKPDSIILTIGAQMFDPFILGWHDQPQYDAVSQRDYLPYMNVKIDVDEQESVYKRSIDEGTMKWWQRQSAEAQESAFSPDDRIPLAQALDQLAMLAWNCNRIWVKGPTYDITILENAYSATKRKAPWKFWTIRDARTLFSLFPHINDKFNEHIAVDDCRNQIVLLQECLRLLGITTIK